MENQINVLINHIKNRSVRLTYKRILPFCKMYHSPLYVNLRISRLGIVRYLTPHDVSIIDLEISCRKKLHIKRVMEWLGIKIIMGKM